MDLTALADFHLVAAQGGFSKAARAAARPKATLSRRVADLEKSLGLRLFERGTPLVLTEDGRALLARTQGPLDELAATENAFRGHGDEPSGKLKISAPLLIGQYAMGAIAARFLRLHPAVRMEVISEDRYVDPVQEGYDIVIRGNPRADEDLVGRRFLRVKLLVVAPPGVARPEIGAGGIMPTVPAVVRTSGNDADLWAVEDGAYRFTLRPEPVLRVSSIMTMRDAVLHGAGAALLPNYLVREHIDAGRLVQWGTAVDHEVEVWALHASTRFTSRKVRAFTDFLIASFPDGSIDQALADLHPRGSPPDL